MKRFFSSRWFRWPFWGFVVLVTLLVLVTQWLNWKGGNAWKEAQARLSQENETLDFRQLVHAPIPDETNFCAIPALKNLPLSNDEAAATQRKRFESLQLPQPNAKATAESRPRVPDGASYGVALDVAGWTNWLRRQGTLPVPADSGKAAKDLLDGLSRKQPLLEELTAALPREAAQWTPSWKTRELPELLFAAPVPHYGPMQNLSRYLAVRAIAAAYAGDARTAHDTLLIHLRIARASLEDPFILGTLVSITQLNEACNAIWEVERLHVGNADDFQRLENELRRIDLTRSLLQAYRTERAAGLGAITWIKKRHDLSILQIMASPGDTTRNTWLTRQVARICIPAGLLDLNAADTVDMYSHYLVAPLRERGLASLMDSEEMTEELERRKASRQWDRYLVTLMMPSLQSIGPLAVHTQCLLERAMVASQLGAYHAGNERYPSALTELPGTPTRDLLSGKPLGYQTTPEGRYKLWSVGFDKNDDGGTRVLDAENPNKTKFTKLTYKGDWVWDFPADAQ